MLGYLLGVASTYALLRVDRNQARRGAVTAVVGARKVLESVQQQAQQVAGGLMEDLQDILNEAKTVHDAEKAATAAPPHSEAAVSSNQAKA